MKFFGLYRQSYPERMYVIVGCFALGFGPYRFLERVLWRNRVLWYNKKASIIHRVRASGYLRGEK